MSITTMGWGSGAITTIGFGVGEGVPAPIATPGPAQQNLFPALLQTKLAKACKVSTDDWLIGIAAADIDLETLESRMARVTSLLRQIEQTDPRVLGAQWALDCKIDEVEYDNKLAVSDVSLDSLESRMAALKA
jgi:hypothetical protein